MTFDLPTLIAIHAGIMIGFGGLFALIALIDRDWRIPWQFSAGFALWPLMLALTVFGQTSGNAAATGLGVLSGFLAPTLILAGAAQFGGQRFPFSRCVIAFAGYAPLQLAAALAGLGAAGHLFVQSLFLLAFAALLFAISLRLPREDHRLGRPLALLLSGLAGLAQAARLITPLLQGWEDQSWRRIGASMVFSSTLVAIFGVFLLIILVAERFSSQIRREARSDALTGLAVRRVFDDQIATELSRWRRYRRPFAVILFDIDYFKQVNDAYGHDAGDAALKLIASCGRSVVRPSDLLARFGGDEFALLLRESTCLKACDVAERLLEVIRRTPLQTQRGALFMTGSFGVAATESEDDSVEQIIKRADVALYRVKNRGRDGVAMEFYGCPDPVESRIA